MSHRTYCPSGPMPLASDPAEVSRLKFAAAGQPLPKPDPNAPYIPRREPANVRSRDTTAIFERPARASEMVRCPLPNITRHPHAQATLEKDLVYHFGGFTAYHLSASGWRAPNGQTMREEGMIYEVSYDPPGNDTSNIARECFLRAGAAIGERWTRIEIHSFTTHCAQTTRMADDDLRDALARRQNANRPWDKE